MSLRDIPPPATVRSRLAALAAAFPNLLDPDTVTDLVDASTVRHEAAARIRALMAQVRDEQSKRRVAETTINNRLEELTDDVPDQALPLLAAMGSWRQQVHLETRVSQMCPAFEDACVTFDEATVHGLRLEVTLDATQLTAWAKTPAGGASAFTDAVTHLWTRLAHPAGATLALSTVEYLHGAEDYHTARLTITAGDDTFDATVEVDNAGRQLLAVRGPLTQVAAPFLANTLPPPH